MQPIRRFPRLPATRADLMRLGASFVLALLLWGLVTVSQDPETTRSFGSVPVSVGDIGTLQVVGTVPEVTVTVSGPRSEVSDLVSTDLQVSLDLDDVDGPGQHSVPVDIEGPNGVWEASSSPARLPIVVDESVVRQMPIETEVVGNVDATRQVSAVPIDVANVDVRGPKQSVDSIARVVVPIEIADQVRGFTSAYTPEARDSAGMIVSGVTITPEIVPIRVEVNARGKQVAVIAQIDGEPAQGYEVVDRTINPGTVLVDGPSDILDELISVSTAPIDITGASDTLYRRVQVTGIPAGVTILDPPEGAVDVVVQIRLRGVRQPLPGQPVVVTGIGDGLRADVEPSDVSVTVLASQEELSRLTAEDVIVQVSVADLGPGVYTLQPIVALPPNVTWVASDPPMVTVTLRDASAQEVVAPAASATP